MLQKSRSQSSYNGFSFKNHKLHLQSRIFHHYWGATSYRWSDSDSEFCCMLRAFFSQTVLLQHKASVFKVSIRNDVNTLHSHYLRILKSWSELTRIQTKEASTLPTELPLWQWLQLVYIMLKKSRSELSKWL